MAQAAPPIPPRTSPQNAPPVNANGPWPSRRTSLSSFPASRPLSPTSMSHHARAARSPQPPPTVPETDRTSNPSSKSKTPSIGVSSHTSSLSGSGSGTRRYNPDARPPRRLKSQYPRGSTDNHVEYILVASFDIDRGPVMEHQFPVAITGDEHMLAELMLPDQAHVRNQDWTIFFLHKDTSQEEEEEQQRQRERRRRRRARKRNRIAGIISEEDEEGLEEDEGDADDWDDDDESTDSEPEGGEGPPLIYVLNLVNTKQDKSVKRGAIVKAMAICTRHPFLHIYKVCLPVSRVLSSPSFDCDFAKPFHSPCSS